MNEMQEALSAIEGKIEVAPSKVPEGKVLVAVKLDRDAARAGRFIEAIDRDWQSVGLALAMRGGHVVAGNPLFGRWTNGVPKVSAMHWVKCSACGKTTPMPLAVWEAKDIARRQGVDIPREAGGHEILKKYGSCPCGQKWHIDDAGERAMLEAFSAEVLDALGSMEKVPPYVGPTAFSVLPLGAKTPDTDAEWQWLTEAMAKAGKAVTPFKKDQGGDVVIYNPGFWLGYVDDYDQTNLFWVENGKSKAHGRHASSRSSFNPGEVDGL